MKTVIAFILSILAVATPTAAQEVAGDVDTTYVQDGVRVYELAPLTISARRVAWGARETPLDKDDLNHALEKSGVGLIRRGVFMASDVYLNGFKRGDLEVTVDGERYPNACPNRMDPPITRVNPLEMEAVVVDGSSASLQSGIGGAIAYRRSQPSDPLRVRGGVSASGASGRSFDGALSVEKSRQRLSVQVVRGEPYTDGRGADFANLYGYREANHSYGRVEVAFHGQAAGLAYGATLSATDDVPFPYLQMDERYDRMWGAHVSYGGNKLYVNRTAHSMDNALRVSSDKMFMQSDATNLTVGLTGRHYEAFYREWGLWNRFEPRRAAQWQGFEQHMLPDVAILSAAAYHAIQAGPVRLTGRLGFNQFRIRDEDRLSFYQGIFPEAEASRLFVPFAATASASPGAVGPFTVGLMAEVASEVPEAQTLYISVRKPMGKPYWSGNPKLTAPVKMALRGTVGSRHAGLEGYAVRVADYVHPRKAASEGQPFLTYRNIDAVMLGFSAYGTWRLLDAQAAYTWARNQSEGTPLADTSPFTAASTVRTPTLAGGLLFLRGDFAAAQSRVDAVLGEEAHAGLV